MTVFSRAALVAAIDALLVSNLDGDITGDNLNDLVNNILDSVYSVYGGLYVTGNASAQNVTTTPAKITAWANTFAGLGTTPSAASDNITIDSAGDYEVTVSLTLNPVAAATWRFYLYRNAAAVNGFSMRVVADGTSTYNLSMTFYVSCAATDTLSVYAESSVGGGANVTIQDGQFTARRVA